MKICITERTEFELCGYSVETELENNDKSIKALYYDYFHKGKAELIEQIAHDADITILTAARALDATLAAIASTLKAGGAVSLVGFGKFEVIRRSARMGRNPRTGQAIKLDSSRAVKFTAWRGLKEELN